MGESGDVDMSGPPFAPRLMVLWAVTVMAVLVAAGCGSDDDGDGAATSSSDTSVTSSSSATTGTMNSSSSETSPSSKTSSSSDTSATSAAARPTVADLEQALAAEIEAINPEVSPGVVDCDASGELADWQPVLCLFTPDDPQEFGGIHVSMLDGGRYAWAPGECCDGAPWPADYPAGLFCRDLAEPPPGAEPGRYMPESDHLTYGLAVFYWLTENRADRMDADLNGRPCETIYPTDEVAAFWDSRRSAR